MSALTVVLLGVLGGLGAVCRFLVDAEVKARLGGRFPVGTLLVNLVGSLLLGALTAAVLRRGLAADVRLVLGTGFCGGFTTFSTATVDCVRLVQAGRPLAALGYLLATAVGSLGCAAVGFALLA